MRPWKSFYHGITKGRWRRHLGPEGPVAPPAPRGRAGRGALRRSAEQNQNIKRKTTRPSTNTRRKHEKARKCRTTSKEAWKPMKTHEKNTRKAIMSANDSKNWKYEEKWENTGKEATAKRWRYRKEHNRISSRFRRKIPIFMRFSWKFEWINYSN